MSPARDLLRSRGWTIVAVVLPAIAVLSVAYAPYGNATLSNCPLPGDLAGCTTLRAGSPLFGYAVEASGALSLNLLLIALLLGLTGFGLFVPWAIASPRRAGPGVIAWAFFAGVVCTIGPWTALEPLWGYGVITGCLWASLGVGLVRRRQARQAEEWARLRLEAEEQARRVREEELRAQQARDRAQRDAAESSRRVGPSRPPRAVLDAAALLGVDAGDPPEVIDAAYKSWVRTLHPDRNPNPKEATRQLQRINNAREILLAHQRPPGSP